VGQRRSVEMNNLSGLAGLGFWLFIGLVSCAIVAAVMWARTRERQMRHDVILKLLETGKSLDPETLDKLLAPARAPSPVSTDPRAGYRSGNFIVFLIGFATLLYAFLRHAGLSYPLIALGVIAIVMAFLGWWVGDKSFRDGTLPTLKYKRDPREAHLNAGFVFFLIGYGTMLIGVTREGGVSYPIIGLGLLLVVMWFNVWRVGNKEYREGRLTGTPLDRERA
jgi:hypothetical protein